MAGCVTAFASRGDEKNGHTLEGGHGLDRHHWQGHVWTFFRMKAMENMAPQGEDNGTI